MRPTFAEINLSNLIYNFLNIGEKVKKSKVMTVVKADAYGHGMIECVNALKTLGDKAPDFYGVALTEEAVTLRKEKSVKEPVLTFSPFSLQELDDYFRYNISVTICDENHLTKIKRIKQKKKLNVHVNVDTGMGRLGIHHSEAVRFIKALAANEHVNIEGVYTHFATSDEKNKSFARTQLSRFNNIIEELKKEKINYGLAHAANSGAILDLPESYFDMVRVGISLYGYYPSLETSESIKLKPVMSLVSKISSIRKIRKGESVSYGRKFIADRDTSIASLPLGYADGISRLLSNKIQCIINNNLFDQVGRVTMDRILINIGNGKLKQGDKAILIGKTKSYQITAWDWCRVIDTIPYEITCNISKRVPRVYI